MQGRTARLSRQPNGWNYQPVVFCALPNRVLWKNILHALSISEATAVDLNNSQWLRSVVHAANLNIGY